jgi:transcriptional regulator with XRE-family HTH domain
MSSAGAALRNLREAMGLTMREVEAASAALVRNYCNHEYAVPISRLCDYETKSIIPSLHRLYSLAVIYRQDFQKLLRLYGIELADQPGSYLEPIRSAARIPPRTAFALVAKHADISAAREPRFHSRKTVYLGQIRDVVETLPWRYLQQFANSRLTCGFIGTEDWTMYPLLPPASLVLIDETRARVTSGGWSSEYERPVYFVETRDTHFCCWCTVTRESIILTPHPLSPVKPRVLRHHDAEVLGEIVGAALVFNRQRSVPATGTVPEQ